jgi:hypothetical protein
MAAPQTLILRASANAAGAEASEPFTNAAKVGNATFSFAPPGRM